MSFSVMSFAGLIAVALLSGGAGSVAAAGQDDVPDSVMTPYRAYVEAFEAGDLEAMTARSEEALHAARAARLDQSLVLTLMENHAQALADAGRHEEAAEAFVSLSRALGRNGANSDRASAHVRAAQAFEASGQPRPAGRHASRALRMTDDDPVDDAGRVLRLAALQTAMRAAWSQGKVSEAGLRARDGLDLLEDMEAVPDGVDLADMAFAAATGCVLRHNGPRGRRDLDCVVQTKLSHAAARAAQAESPRTDRLGAWSKVRIQPLDEEERSDLADRMRASVHNALFTEADFDFPQDEIEAGTEGFVRTPPYYPEEAARRRLDGVSLHRFDVGVDGVPENIVVLDAVPDLIFGAAGVAAITEWRYPPLIVDGEPARREDVVTSFTFTIDG